VAARLFVLGCGVVLGALVVSASHAQMSGPWPAFTNPSWPALAVVAAPASVAPYHDVAGRLDGGHAEAVGSDVRADEQEAAMPGANGVPFFVLDREFGVSGGQPAEVFTQALEEAWTAHTLALKVVGDAPDGAVSGPDDCELP